jgi:hypothetical protein
MKAVIIGAVVTVGVVLYSALVVSARADESSERIYENLMGNTPKENTNEKVTAR